MVTNPYIVPRVPHPHRVLHQDRQRRPHSPETQPQYRREQPQRRISRQCDERYQTDALYEQAQAQHFPGRQPFRQVPKRHLAPHPEYRHQAEKCRCLLLRQTLGLQVRNDLGQHRRIGKAGCHRSDGHRIDYGAAECLPHRGPLVSGQQRSPRPGYSRFRSDLPLPHEQKRQHPYQSR